MKLLVASLAVLAALCLQSEAKTFSRCGLVKELKKQGFPRDKLRDWVCLVEHESSRRTELTGPRNTDGSRDHGLFQINDRYWCDSGRKAGKGCQVRCADLRSDNISKASKCAKKIFQAQGFSAWAGWKSHCRGKPLPDISKC